MVLGMLVKRKPMGSSATPAPLLPVWAPLRNKAVPSGRRIPSDMVCAPLDMPSIRFQVGVWARGCIVWQSFKATGFGMSWEEPPQRRTVGS